MLTYAECGIMSVCHSAPKGWTGINVGSPPIVSATPLRASEASTAWPQAWIFFQLEAENGAEFIVVNACEEGRRLEFNERDFVVEVRRHRARGVETSLDRIDRFREGRVGDGDKRIVAENPARGIEPAPARAG